MSIHCAHIGRGNYNWNINFGNVVYGWWNVKNKQVKQMIVRIRDKKDGVHVPFFGHYFDKSGLNECFPCGWGPDNYSEDSIKIKQGVVSLTANQLKDIK